MSIYPVHIKSFMQCDDGDDFERSLGTINIVIETSDGVCSECKNTKLTEDNLWAMHSLCWGYGGDELWCSGYCAYGLAEKLTSDDPKVRAYGESLMKSFETDESPAAAVYSNISNIQKDLE